MSTILVGVFHTFGLILNLVGALALANSLADAQSRAELFSKVESSAVQVICPMPGSKQIRGTGFVWRQRDLVVSALHVVDNCNNILVHYSTGDRCRARAIKILKDADLVLLRVENPPDVPALAHTPKLPSLDEQLFTLGWGFDITAIKSFEFKLSYGGRKLRDNIKQKALTELRECGYPNPDLDVLMLGGESLLPGHSGAPIFNGNGKVVGISDGGLEQGAINISWAIPADHLTRLWASTDEHLPGSKVCSFLFKADQQSEIGQTIKSGDFQLVKVRTRSLPELISSADELLGLQQLSTLFSVFTPSSFQYDIYQETRSGATVALPHGSGVEPQDGGYWKVSTPETAFDQANGTRRLQMVLQIMSTGSLPDANAQSQLYEEKIKSMYPQVTWQVDPQWTYLGPYSRFDGLIVRRIAASGYVLGEYDWVTDKYWFETLAVKNDVFLGLAVVNEDNSPETANKVIMCGQGYQLPECPLLFESGRAWAQVVLGIQLTSFGL